MKTALLLLSLAATAPRAAPPAAPAATETPAAAEPAAEEGIARKDVGPLLREVLGEKHYSFCHEPRYPLTQEELGWCALAPKDDQRCPAFQQACAQGATANRIEQKPTEIKLPELPPIGRGLVWLALGAALATLIYWLAKQALAYQRREKDAPAPAAAVEIVDEAAAAARLVETDVARLLERARAAAARGDFARAIADAYAALLRRLEGSGVIHVEPHRTNGDHVRDVGAKQPPLKPRVQAVVAVVEEVEFGGAPADAERFRFVHDRVLGLVAEKIGVLLLLVGVCLGVPGCKGIRERWDDSPSGRGAVLALLKRYGFDARERLSALSRLDGKVDQLLLGPGATLTDKDWETVRAWVAEGGQLYVLGGERTLPAWLGATVDQAGSKSSSPITLASDQKERFGKLKIAVPPHPAVVRVKEAGPAPAKGARTDEDDDCEECEEDAAAFPLVMRGPLPYAYERDHGIGRVVVFADDLLFINAALLVADNAHFVTELLREGGGKQVELANELTGLVATNPVSSVSRGRLAPALVQLLAAALLFFLFKGARFGRPMDPAAGGRRAFAEHARALGLQYARARAHRMCLELYGAYAVERLRERLNLGSTRSLSAVAEAIAARTGRPLGEVMRLLVEARESEPAAPAPKGVRARDEGTDDLATMRQLAQLVSQLTGGPGERTRVQGKG